jgi:methionyl-tRNA formyltransferase
MRIVMMGTGIFAEPTFEALLGRAGLVVGLFTQPDRVVGQERGSTRQTGRGMKTIAQEQGVPVFQPDSVNTHEGVAMLRSLSPDLLVVAAYGQILSGEVLSIPPQGGINVHASLLPKYRGAAPIAWAIYHGETHTGVTIIRMSTGLDAGDMLAQEAIDIDIGTEQTAGEVEAVLAPLGARLALQVVDQIMSGHLPQGVKQDKSLVTKAPKLTKEHGIIDWTRSADRVCCQVRAMHPWPTAFTFWHREGQPPLRLIVHRATSRPTENPSPQPPPRSGEGEPEKNPSPQPPPRSGEGEPQARSDGDASSALLPPLRFGEGGGGGGVASLPPGTILADNTTTLCVAAGENSIVEIHELQPAGKKRMSAAEFLRGRRPMPGDRLGPETP